MFGTLFVTTLHDCQMSMQQCLDHAIANKLETQDALHSKVKQRAENGGERQHFVKIVHFSIVLTELFFHSAN